MVERSAAMAAIVEAEAKQREFVAACAGHWWGQVHEDHTVRERTFEEMRLFEAVAEWHGLVKARELLRKVEGCE